MSVSRNQMYKKSGKYDFQKVSELKNYYEILAICFTGLIPKVTVL